MASLCLHVLIVSALIKIDWGPAPRRFQGPVIEQLIAEESHKLVWRPLQKDLPAVAPLESSAPESTPARARFRMPGQTIVAADPNPDSSRQTIFGPAPEIKLERDVPSPNLLAWKPPNVTMPRFEVAAQEKTKPAQRAVTPDQAPEITAANSYRLDLERLQPLQRLRYRGNEKEQAAPSRQALLPDQAPRVEAAAAARLDVERLQKREPLRFWAPEKKQTRPAATAVSADEAPGLEVSGDAGLDVEKIQPIQPFRYWTPETQQRQPSQTALVSGRSAPEVEAAALGGSVLDTVNPVSRLRYWSQTRTEAAPQKKALALAAGSTVPLGEGEANVRSGTALPGERALAEASRSLEGLSPPAGVPGPDRNAGGLGSATQTQEGASSGDGAVAGIPGGPPANGEPNLGVIGLDPDPNAPNSIPAGRRRGRFSASPDGGSGQDPKSGPTTMAEVRVPHLSVSGAAGAAPALAITRPPVPKPSRSGRPDDNEAGLEVLTRFRNPREYTQLPRPTLETAPPLARPDDPDVMFIDRAVYAMAVNMPNITSYAGSWIIRFAELGGANGKKANEAGKLSAPSPRFKVDPRYIRTAVEEGVEGKVVLYAVIHRDGLVGDVRVMKSLDERLDESAVAAFSKWQFQPATNDLGPVDVEAVVEIPFQLTRPEGYSR